VVSVQPSQFSAEKSIEEVRTLRTGVVKYRMNRKLISRAYVVTDDGTVIAP
jgi:hypothetical protein